MSDPVWNVPLRWTAKYATSALHGLRHTLCICDCSHRPRFSGVHPAPQFRLVLADAVRTAMVQRQLQPIEACSAMQPLRMVPPRCM